MGKPKQKVNIVLGKKMWAKLNKIAKNNFGEFGFSTLSEDQMKEALNIACTIK